MSKRPNTANPFPSRLRRPMGRLRDMPIWSKLGLLMVAPMVAVAVVGTTGLVDHLETLDGANRARNLAALTEASGVLVHDLQDERATAVLLLGFASNANREKYLQAYNNVHARVDRSKVPYAEHRSTLGELPVNLSGRLNRINRGLSSLPATRSQVASGKLKLTDAAQMYEGLISELLDLRDSASQFAGDTALSERMRAGASVARAKEFVSARRIVVHRALVQSSFTSVLRTEFIATQTGQQQALQSFKAVATGTESEFFNQTVAGSDQRDVENFSNWIQTNNSQNMSSAPFDADDWDAAMAGNSKSFRIVESRLDSAVVNQATALRDEVRQQVLLETGLLLGMLLLAILFAWLVARSMARSLRELRHGALSIAEFGLPQAVARLRDPQLIAHMSPVEVANQIAEPLPVRSKDEFGQVTEAFNAVHLEAVRTAAEQAALRSSVATMFVNLARRSQILVARLIGHLDRLERGEEDPDRLAELFQLDHLATRMRRNDENLLVLAGADSTRVQRESAALIDVLRAAQSEVEHYTRIEFGVIDRDIEVAAHAVNDLVHLIAELFDNATAFSQPDSSVMVEARRVGDRAALYVEDRGIGITPEQLQELNERLATPPIVDVAVSRMMGLVVVARLASRHSVKVELRPGTDRGTVADVTLPTSVLVSRALAGQATQSGGFPVVKPPAPAQSAPPLALASGSDASRPWSGNRESASRPSDPPVNGGGRPSRPERSMPAWSDLTGATGARNGRDDFASGPTNGRGMESGALPQRRSTGPDGSEEFSADGREQGIPRQLPSNPEVARPPAADWGRQQSFGSTTGAYPASPVTPVPDRPAGPILPGQPVSAPPHVTGPRPASPSGAPPAWPPVKPPANQPERDFVAPPVPERVVAALDLTTELPRIPRSAPEYPSAQNRPKFADETMELPIFRELESVWFQTCRPSPDEVGRASASTSGQVATTMDTATPVQNTATGPTSSAAMTNMSRGTGAPRTTGPAPAGYGGGTGAPTGRWETAADQGWRAASAAKAAPVAETTKTGLPKRVPMAQLVPGGVDKPASSVQRRTPESVRGLLSAYHRGVQRGRTHPAEDKPTNPEATPAGQQSSRTDSGRATGKRPEGA